MILAIPSPQVRPSPVRVTMPVEPGLFALKTVAFATALVACGTTSAQASSVSSVRLNSSSSGFSVAAREQDVRDNLSGALEEIKSKSGLTWGQLAGLFDVSRRTVHSWANGAAIRAANAGRVHELLDHVRQLETLPAFKIREKLLGLLSGPTNGALPLVEEPPILASDNSPFAHQLELRPARTKVKRG